MHRLLLLLTACSLLLACNQQNVPTHEVVVHATKPKALIAERVEGTSPFTVRTYFTPEEPRAEQETHFTFVVAEGDKPLREASVRVSLVMPLMDMGKNEFEAKEASTPGLYEGTGKFTMGDEWEIFVTVTKDGKKGVHVFNVRVQE